MTGRQLHIGYTLQEKRIIPSNCINGCINEDLKLRKEEEGKGRREVSYIYCDMREVGCMRRASDARDQVTYKY